MTWPRGHSEPVVVVTRRWPTEVENELRRRCPAVRLSIDDTPLGPDGLRHAFEHADAVLPTVSDALPAELFEGDVRTRFVGNFGVGTDHIDLGAARAAGVTVTNTPGVLTETTADLAFTLLAAAARRIPEGVDYVRDGHWKTWGPMLLMGVDLHGGTLGIVGFGRIGRELARRGRGFGMRVLYHDVYPASPEEERELGAERVDMERLLRESDFISLHVNLTDETRHLIDADALRAMKPTAVLVNTSRGPVVDTEALADALETGEIFAAGLDVTDPEPLPADHRLVRLPNCIVVPHIASASRVTRGKMAAMAAANVLAGIRGERLPTPINPEVYDAPRA